MIVERLPNRLHLVVIPDATMPTPFTVVAFRAGTRFETPATAGFGRWWAESLPHGTPQFPTRRVVLASFEDAEAELSHFADIEMVGLMATGESAHRVSAHTLLRDLIENPLHRAARSVRHRLMTEWGADQDVEDRIHEKVFGEHPLGQGPAACFAALRTASEADLRAYAQEWIHPENGVVVCYCPAGESEQVHRELTQVWSSWQPRQEREKPITRPSEGAGVLTFADAHPVLPPSDPQAPFFFPSLRKGPLLEHVARSQALTQFRILWLGDGQGSPAFLAQEILIEVLAGEGQGRLHDLDENPDGLVNLGYQIRGFTDVSLFEIQGRCPPQRLRVVLRDLYREIFRTKREPLPEREFLRARRRVATRHAERNETPQLRALEETRAHLLGMRRTPDATLLTMAEVQAAAQSMIVEDRMAVFLVGKVPRVDRGDIIQLVNGTLG